MKKKSKFLTFILSAIPGLGHVYLGFALRGAFFFAALIALGIFLALFEDITYRIGFSGEIFILLFPVIWLASLVDSMVIADKINSSVTLSQNGEKVNIELPNYSELSKQNKKIISMFLSVIPGAGHLYLGLKRQGVELMAGFFLAFYLTDWLRLGILMIFVPIIWFYSLFDVMHKVSGNRAMTDDEMLSNDWLKDGKSILSRNSFFKNKDKAIGYGIIFVGVILLFNRLLLPLFEQYIDYRIRGNIQTGIVALLLIAGGIKLVVGTRTIDAESTQELNKGE